MEILNMESNQTKTVQHHTFIMANKWKYTEPHDRGLGWQSVVHYSDGILSLSHSH